MLQQFGRITLAAAGIGCVTVVFGQTVNEQARER
jgi:hypothetical protein